MKGRPPGFIVIVSQAPDIRPPYSCDAGFFEVVPQNSIRACGKEPDVAVPEAISVPSIHVYVILSLWHLGRLFNTGLVLGHALPLPYRRSHDLCTGLSIVR